MRDDAAAPTPETVTPTFVKPSYLIALPATTDIDGQRDEATKQWQKLQRAC